VCVFVHFHILEVWAIITARDLFITLLVLLKLISPKIMNANII
jgi:hypothetical protein